MSEMTQEFRELKLTTALGGEVLLIERISGSERLGQPFEFVVSAVCENDSFSFDDLVGTKATVTFKQRTKGAADERYFDGYVSRLSHAGYSAQGHSRYELVLVPWIWFLAQQANCRIFQNQTVPEILEDIFKGHPQAKFELKLDGSYPARTYCVQYRETDLNFAQRLMEHEGIYYFWVHDESGHRMIVCDDMSIHQPVPGFGELFYRAEGGMKDRDFISSWKVSHVVTPGAYTVNGYNFESPNPSPNTKLLSRDEKLHEHAAGQHGIYHYTGDYLERGEGERLAEVRREEAQVDSRTVVFQTNARGLSCGSVVVPLEVPRKDQSGQEFLVVAASFHASSGSFGSGMGAGDAGYESTLSAIPVEGCIFRSKRSAFIPRMQGVQTAMVTGPENEEIFVDKHGRVKVQFHWDLEGQYDDGTSCWIRVAQAWAGAGWGAMAIPRVGQEVIVDFIEGDPDQPIITGRVYNGDHPVPYELPKEKTKTTFKSNSTPEGGKGHNEWRFEDKKGKEQIYFHAQKDMDQRVRNVLRETTYGSRHELTGWFKAEDEHGGSRFVTDNSERHELIMDKSMIEVGKVVNVIHHEDLMSYHEKNKLVFAKESYRLSSEGPVVFETTQNIALKSQTDLKMQGLSAVHLGGNAVTVDGHSLTLRGGGAFIKLDASGITMQGPMVKVNSGGFSQGAEAPESNEVFQPEQPTLAAAAVDSLGGGKKRYRSGGRRSPFPPPGGWAQAESYEPLPDIPPDEPPRPPIPPPDPTESDVPCGIKELTVGCGHHADRKVKGGQTLVVVPTPASVTSRSRKIGSGSWSIEFGITEKKGGTDSITIDVDTVEGGKGQSRISNSPSGSGAWGSGAARAHSGLSNEPPRIWTLNTQPRMTYVQGKGCDDVVHQVTVATLPPESYEYSAKVEELRDVIEELNEALSERFKVDFGPVSITPKLVPPSGELKVGFGWAEDPTPEKAVFKLSGSASVSMGAGIEFSVSLMEVAYASALSSIGIPPPASTELAELGAEYLADILVGIEITVSPKFTGEVYSEWYYPGGGRVGGRFALGVEGKVKAFITGKVGNGRVAGVSVTGAAETGMLAEGGIDISTEGISLDALIKCNGLEFSVSIVLETFAFDWEEGFKWKPIDDFDIWKPDPVKLMDFD